MKERAVKRPVAFELNVDPSAEAPESAVRIAAIADEAGLEYVGVQDHPYNPAVHRHPGPHDLASRPHQPGALITDVSSGGFSNISQLLTYWGLIDAFVDIYCRESPYHLDLTTKLERLRHAIEHRTGPMAIVEDSQEILRLAKMMGLRTIGVRHDLNDAEEINADFVIDCR
jgi:hypothetical protein